MTAKKAVLIIGGYGQFGRRLAERLANIANLDVIVAGRTIAKAEKLCAKIGGNLRPAFFDTGGDIDAQLRELSPWLVVDAAGPFQSVFEHGYALPTACIRQEIHYIDLSDSGTFTQGISALDAQAQQARVAVISGASSVPALSSAVIDGAADNFSHITSIEGGISPGGKIDIGLSVTQAVLSYLGKPLKLYVGGDWRSELGYSRVHKHEICLAGEAKLVRYFGLCDAPDLLLFPQHYRGVETVRFYGSPEMRIIHISIRVLAWLQRHGIVRNLQKHAKIFAKIGTWLGRFASERGGMYMLLTGLDGDQRPINMQWNLIASQGGGPYIPTLAAEILIRRWTVTPPPAGARPAVSQISIAEFEQAFSTLSIKSGYSPPTSAPYLFARVLGVDFSKLPEALQRGHQVANTKIMHGLVDVERGKNPLPRFIANVVGFSHSGNNQPISVEMDMKRGREIWTRTINGKSFRSTLSKGPVPYEIYEQFGPIKFKMKFRLQADKLYYDIVSAKVWGVPFPRFLLPKSLTHERVEAGRFVFDVEIRLPISGRLIAYKGWLA